MQKFGLLFLAVSTALVGLVVPVQGAALTDRETNAKRFAQGLTPLPPRAVSEREVAKRTHPSNVKRDPTPTFEERDHQPSKRADVTVERRNHPSKRADATVEKRNHPSKRADTTVEKRNHPSKRADASVVKRNHPSKRADSTVVKRNHPSKRADATVVRRTQPSKRADATVVKRTQPSKRADVTVERRNHPSKRADATVEKRNHPSKRADATVEKRTQPSKRSDATVVKRTQPSKRADATVEKRTQPSKRAEVEEVFETQQWEPLTSGRLEVRWVGNNSIAGYVANNANGGSFGLNPPLCHGGDDLYVEYFNLNLMVMNPEFPPPYFVGGGDESSAVHDCSDKIRFGTVELGSSSAVWTVDPMSGKLTATLINQDGSEDQPSLVYDSVHNVLSFTHHVNPMTEHVVSIFLSD
jgi:hypothetical protein